MARTYSIRERWANIMSYGRPDAYPGQKARILEMLIEHDAQVARNEADLAVIARREAGAMRRASTIHFYEPGERTGDPLAACITCGRLPTATGFGWLHEPSRLTEAEARAAWGDR